jgi:hypothetical protein
MIVEGNLRLDTAQTLRDFMTAMPIIPYDDPANLFRVYAAWECEEDGSGYPFIWDAISECRRAGKLYRCEDCGFAYLEDGDILTVHHNNFNKADCRKENLAVYCWLHHSLDHEPDLNMRDMRCKYCKAWFLGWPRLHRHIKGIHRPFELKIPEITLDQRPTSYVGRGRVLAAIQQQQRWRELWRD